MQFMFRPLLAYFDFKGRARRAEYWQWFLLNVIVGFVCGFIGEAASGMKNWVNIAQTVWVFATFIPGLAVGVRRLHDINRTGWWMLYIVLVPALTLHLTVAAYFLSRRFAVAEPANAAPGMDYVLPAAIAVAGCLLMIPALLMMIKDGTPRNNRFGPDPKGRGDRISVF